MKKILAFLFLLSLPLLSFCQVGLAFFSNELQIAASTNYERRFWGELRLSTNSDSELNFGDGGGVDMRPWLVGHANIKKNSQVSLSLGLGITSQKDYYDYSPFWITTPLAIRFNPLKQEKIVAFLAEFAPTFNGDDLDPKLSWGVRYLFLKEQ